MARLTATLLALGLAASVSAQSTSASATMTSSASAVSGSVVSVFLLDSDPQSLVASLVSEKNGIQTLAVQCAPGVSSDACGYPSAITVTAGPSTVHASGSMDGLTAEYGCDLTGTTTGTCSITYQGEASDLASDDAAASTATGRTTITTSGTLAATDITLFPITVTAGAAVSSASTASRSSSSSASSRSSSASGSSSTASMSAAGADKIVVPGFLAAGLLGLAALL